MSNGSTVQIPYYLGAPSQTSLDSMPLTWGDGALANIFGTSTFATGTDAAARVNDALNTEPGTAPKIAPEPSASWLDNFIVFGPEAVAKKKAQIAASGGTDPGSLTPILYGALVVVIGLLIISRGFGLLGEEGESVAVTLANPSKYPGVGHAISHLRKKG